MTAQEEAPPPSGPASPVEEARRAVGAARDRLAAAAALLAAGGADAPQRAQAEAAPYAEQVARALWYLRRAEREGSGGERGSGAG
jgi:hypothetical protein